MSSINFTCCVNKIGFSAFETAAFKHVAARSNQRLMQAAVTLVSYQPVSTCEASLHRVLSLDFAATSE